MAALHHVITILAIIGQCQGSLKSQWANPQLAKGELYEDARFLNISYLAFNTTTAALISGAILFIILNIAFIGNYI